MEFLFYYLPLAPNSTLIMIRFVAVLLFCVGVARCSLVNNLELQFSDAFRQAQAKAVAGVGASTSCPTHKAFYVKNVAQQPEIATLIQTLNARGPTLLQKFAPAGATAMHFSVVFFNETVYSGGFGTRRFDKPSQMLPPDENTIFRIGSVSKLFASLQTYIAADKKKISLEDPVSDTVADFSVVPPFPLTGRKGAQEALGGVTWRQLLSQMSGIAREPPCSGANCTEDTATMLKRIAQMPLDEMPDTRAKYSNLAFDLLGNLVAERLFGTTWETMMNQQILSPLGMLRTGGNFTNVLRGFYGDNIALSFLPNTNHTFNRESWLDMGWGSPAGNMFSTPKDLCSLLQEYIRGYALNGTLLTRQTFYRDMIKPQYVGRDVTTGFASPFELLFFDSHVIARKGGNVPGYTALTAVAPESGFGLVFFINSGFNELGDDGVEMVELTFQAFADMFARLATPPPPVPSRGLSDYYGVYNVATRVSHQTLPLVASISPSMANPGMIHLNFSFVYVPRTAGVDLRWLYNDTFASVYPEPTSFSCILFDALAGWDVVFAFHRDTSGVISWLESPGFAWDVVYEKQ